MRRDVVNCGETVVAERSEVRPPAKQPAVRRERGQRHPSRQQVGQFLQQRAIVRPRRAVGLSQGRSRPRLQNCRSRTRPRQRNDGGSRWLGLIDPGLIDKASAGIPGHQPRASRPLAARTFISTTAKPERSSGRKAALPAGDAGVDAGKKRSSKEEMRSVFSGSAADASADRSESVIQAAAPSDTATAAKASAIVSDHPMRRRDNSPSAIAASKAIKPPIQPRPNAQPIPRGSVEQSKIMRAKKVRHNRDKGCCSSLLPFGNSDPSL